MKNELTKNEERDFVTLLTIMDLGGSATKRNALDNIIRKEFLYLSEYDYEYLPSRNEPRWENAIAYQRNSLKERGYINNKQNDKWEITDNGINYFNKLFNDNRYGKSLNLLDSNAFIVAESIVRNRLSQ
jgi:hypothetical protein